jgi:hypothetical protein
LHDLLRAFENGDRLFLFSERRIGKTSLVKIALEQLPADDYLQVYVDLWPTSNESEFALRFAKAITESTKTAVSTMLSTAKEFFGAFRPAVTVEDDGKPKVIFGASPNDTRPPDLELVLDAIPKLVKQTGKSMAIVLDEFQQVTEYGSEAVERKLRSAIQHHERVSYVFLGSKKHLLEAMFMNKQRPLYRAAAHYPLGMISEKDWQPFILDKFTGSGKGINEDTIARICAFTQGHPFYTQHLCHALWELTERGSAVPDDGLEMALDLLLTRESSAFMALWESLAANQRALLTALATTTSDNVELFGADFLRASGLRTASSMQRAVNALIQKDLIDRDDKAAIYIPDRFLRLWIQRRMGPS